MSNSKKSPFEAAQEQIDLRLGGLLGELGSALTEAIEKLDAQGAGEVQTERTFDSGAGPVRASAGVRIRTLGGTTSAARQTRAPDKPVNRPAPATEEPAARPITATILDNATSWQLIAELPGVDTDGVDLKVDGTRLSITATGRGRAYASVFDLPPGATEDALKLTVQNGILEIFFNKPEPQT